MLRSSDVDKLIELFDKEYGTDLVCYLDHENAWQLLFATILSAQCTDLRVNIVTKELFAKYPTLEDVANANLQELEAIVKPTGFFRNKAINIINCAKILVTKYGGIVPSDIEELTQLPGVGRKTANVIRGNVYGIQSIVVDTHVKRISNLLGLTTNDDPVKIEFDLMKIIPKEHWILVNLQFIAHGRKVCIARRPKCDECVLANICSYNARKN